MLNLNNNEKRTAAIEKLEQWLYELYATEAYPVTFADWQQVKFLKLKYKFTEAELSILHDLWDKYVEYIKETNAR